ncbi:hypothetical protein SDC9_178185 [bioreactor metagenome]|uniref:Uncharacterized protein n=1 Tax=bioreactor metagenome TaxID=1076179 RepID=A0A645H330_9ZZZZ
MIKLIAVFDVAQRPAVESAVEHSRSRGHGGLGIVDHAAGAQEVARQQNRPVGQIETLGRTGSFAVKFFLILRLKPPPPRPFSGCRVVGAVNGVAGRVFARLVVMLIKTAVPGAEQSPARFVPHRPEIADHGLAAVVRHPSEHVRQRDRIAPGATAVEGAHLIEFVIAVVLAALQTHLTHGQDHGKGLPQSPDHTGAGMDEATFAVIAGVNHLQIDF